MESKFKFGFDPAIEKKLAERQPMFPRLYELGDMKFATLTEIPGDIFRDMQHSAYFIQRQSWMDEMTKREEIKNIFNHGVERAMEREYYNGDRWINNNKDLFNKAERIFEEHVPVNAMPTSSPSMDYFQKKAEEELRAGQIKMSDFLGCMKPYHPGGILAHIHEINELKKDEAELKLPKKHSTHINL